MNKLFRTPSEEEKEAFRAWARKNYVPFSYISGAWHPALQAECTKINEEAMFWDDKAPPPNWHLDTNKFIQPDGTSKTGAYFRDNPDHRL
jgi:hypothetical protein